VTTEKDLGAIAQRQRTAGWARNIVPFAITMEFEEPARLRTFLANRLFAAREKKFKRT